ncbi:hypothetical protein JW906_03915, partial [bacterium]|nr:hypothetical protein [bacterium]
MKTKSMLLSLILVAGIGRSQDWPATAVIDPFPSPYLSDWQTDPTVASLELTNPTGKADVVILDLEVTSGEGARFQGSSERMLVGPDQTVTMNSTEFNAWYTQSLDQTVRDKATRTGMMPEGSYQACITVRNLWGNILAQNVCAFFTIVHPEPPELIYPVAGQEITDPYPVFQWIPPQLPQGKQIVYAFRMVKMMQGQTPEMALSANYPHYENFNVFEANLSYPLEGLPLEPNIMYAWQVQALDFEGRPVTKNEGRSVIGLFAGSAVIEGAQPVLQLLSPEDRTIVTIPLPEFQWMDPEAAVEGPLHYAIRIVEIGRGQSPEQALLLNEPVFSDPDITGLTSLAYPAQAPAWVPGASYAWQVQVRDGFGNPAAANDGMSAVWTFQYESMGIGKEDILPERLPLAGESVAYLELRRDGNPVVDYSVSGDSSSITIRGPVTLVLPALQTGPSAPTLTVNGELTFDAATLHIQQGQVQGGLPAQENSPFNLDQAGVPLILTRIAFQADQPGELACEAVPVLFGRIASNASIEAALLSDGSLRSGGSCLLSESLPVVPNSDKLLLDLKLLSGTIHASLQSGMVQNSLTLEADLAVSTPDQSVRLPVILDLSESGAETAAPVYTGQSLGIDIGVLGLGLSDLACNSLRYARTSGSWFFDLGFDLVMDFED